MKRVMLVLTGILVLALLIVSCVPIQPPTPVPGEEAGAEATAQPAEEAAAALDPEKTLTSVPAEAAPILDGVADDAA
jgi:hypothetical protein